jgi:hypothetical protein
MSMPDFRFDGTITPSTIISLASLGVSIIHLFLKNQDHRAAF